MIDHVLATIARYRMFEPGQRVGVAVSGGADSVALLHVLLELAPRLGGLQLSILHLDHMLRGEESRADAEFVRRLGERLGIFVHFCARNVAELAAQTGDNLEQAARRARHEFFAQAIADGTERIALGHTRSDQAETVLFRFLRGAGTAGLAGVRPVTQNGFVRPLLDVTRAEVEAYLGNRGIPWREDFTNKIKDFARNRIRHELLPALSRDWNPSLADTLARTAEWAQAEEAWWDQEITRVAERLLTRGNGFVLSKVEDLRALHLATARRLVRRAVELVKGDLRGIGFEHIEGILELAKSTEGSGRLQVPGVDVYRSFDWVRFAGPNLDTLENRNFRLPLAVPGTVEVPGSKTVIHLEVMDARECEYNKEMGRLDWDRAAGSLQLRNWRPGDQYHPAGHHSAEKVKTLFQEARIPLWERRTWPVIVRGEEILWTRRFGVASRYAAGSDSRSVLAVREVTKT